MDDNPQLLTKRQLANLLQVSQRTVDRWLAADRLPPACRVQIAGTVRYRPDIAQTWIANGCRVQPEYLPMADATQWTTCPHCGSDISPDDCGTLWCQNCGTLDVPVLPENPAPKKETNE